MLPAGSPYMNNAVKISDWNVPHQYRYYAIAVLATYAGPPVTEVAPAISAVPGAPAAPPAGPALPTFE